MYLSSVKASAFSDRLALQCRHESAHRSVAGGALEPKRIMRCERSRWQRGPVGLAGSGFLATLQRRSVVELLSHSHAAANLDQFATALRSRSAPGIAGGRAGVPRGHLPRGQSWYGVRHLAAYGPGFLSVHPAHGAHYGRRLPVYLERLPANGSPEQHEEPGRLRPQTAAPQAPAQFSPQAVLALQRSAGNAAVGRALAREPAAAAAPAATTPGAGDWSTVWDSVLYIENGVPTANFFRQIGELGRIVPLFGAMSGAAADTIQLRPGPLRADVGVRGAVDARAPGVAGRDQHLQQRPRALQLLLMQLTQDVLAPSSGGTASPFTGGLNIALALLKLVVDTAQASVDSTHHDDGASGTRSRPGRRRRGTRRSSTRGWAWRSTTRRTSSATWSAWSSTGSTCSPPASATATRSTTSSASSTTSAESAARSST